MQAAPVIISIVPDDEKKWGGEKGPAPKLNQRKGNDNWHFIVRKGKGTELL